MIEINQKNMWVIFFIFLQISLGSYWMGNSVDPNSAFDFAFDFAMIILSILIIVFDCLIVGFFFQACMEDEIEFSFQIPIPFAATYKRWKQKSKLKIEINNLKIKLIDLVHDEKRFVKLNDKIEILEKQYIEI